jgi:hypothetical protein
LPGAFLLINLRNPEFHPLHHHPGLHAARSMPGCSSLSNSAGHIVRHMHAGLFIN